MRVNKRLIFGVLGAILIILLLKRCDNRQKGAITDETLKPDETTAIIVNDRGQVTELTRRDSNRDRVRLGVLRGRHSQSPTVPTEIVKRTDGVKDLRISIDNRGNVTYTFRTWGFQFSPEAGIYYAASHPGVTLNDSFFFYRKHEALIGLRFALAGSKEIRPYLAYAYRPRWRYMSNTALVIGIDLDKEFLIGTSTQF